MCKVISETSPSSYFNLFKIRPNIFFVRPSITSISLEVMVPMECLQRPRHFSSLSASPSEIFFTRDPLCGDEVIGGWRSHFLGSFRLGRGIRHPNCPIWGLVPPRMETRRSRQSPRSGLGSESAPCHLNPVSLHPFLRGPPLQDGSPHRTNSYGHPKRSRILPTVMLMRSSIVFGVG